MSTHITTSHGADFFGEDRYSLRTLTTLGEQITGVLPATEREPLERLLRTATPCTIPPADAQQLAALLRKAARHRFMKPALAAQARALGDAAARAAADGEPWAWRIAA